MDFRQKQELINNILSIWLCIFTVCKHNYRTKKKQMVHKFYARKLYGCKLFYSNYIISKHFSGETILYLDEFNKCLSILRTFFCFFLQIIFFCRTDVQRFFYKLIFVLNFGRFEIELENRSSCSFIAEVILGNKNVSNQFRMKLK